MTDRLDNDHKKMVRALAKSGSQIANEMNGEAAHMLHMAVGVAGEAGELLDGVKKAVIYQKPLDRENIIEELGDLEFYMQGLRDGLGITRQETLEANIEKLTGDKGRYKEGYSDKAAQERADKQEDENGAPECTIVVNGRELNMPVNAPISYATVFRAHQPYADLVDEGWTCTYRDNRSISGELVHRGRTVPASNGLVFNIARTI